MSSGLQLLLAASSLCTGVAASGGAADGTDSARKVALLAVASYVASVWQLWC